LTGAPAGGVAVGQPSFTLPIDGTGFTTSSVATWNGARRPTTYVSASRIVATVDAVDLSAPGQFTIGVADTTDNCPGAGALPFGVLAVGAPTSSNLKAIQTWSTALLWHAGLGRLLVASRSGDLTRGYLFAVDPVTGRATDSIFVDPEPGRMTMTDDGKYLFIQTRALDSPQIVKRVQISPFAVVSQFSVPSNVVGLAALPGSSTSVAVADVSHITIYDDGVARPVAQGGGLFIAFGDAGRLYGLANGITPSTLTTNLVASDGVRAQQGGIDDYFASSNTSMLYRAGRLYLTSGYVLTGDRMDQVVGYIGRTATDWSVKTEDALAVDDRRGRAYEIHNGTLTAWDLNTFQALGSVKAAPAPPYPAALVFLPQAVRWGTDGLAYNDIGWLYMFRSPLVAP
ncbi:MAG TPA: hypothetical protein VF461_24505, partial [Gemmatimonadaceae bacterium]